MMDIKDIIPVICDECLKDIKGACALIDITSQHGVEFLEELILKFHKARWLIWRREGLPIELLGGSDSRKIKFFHLRSG
ncbi:hypothetical protein LCGC14_1393920 [marine sediment metagenome]|uniref:Uncharacterized protein n=1 Tax=marine sediment metagenome TaxID=412755 RepID=A0A0F9JZ95_9ZZZZ